MDFCNLFSDTDINDHKKFEKLPKPLFNLVKHVIDECPHNVMGNLLQVTKINIKILKNLSSQTKHKNAAFTKILHSESIKSSNMGLPILSDIIILGFASPFN